jgi:ectoine hydroxylase-related dioxygenase (phytanoyl-CoA dioxygenase family)
LTGCEYLIEMDLQDMDMKFYKENGYWLEEGVFSPKECVNLIEASKHFENYTNRTYRPVMMPHRIDDVYFQALAHPGLVRSISAVIGGKAMGLQTQFFYCKPGTCGFSLHQDNFFVEAPPDAFASAWCALTDTVPENGGLIIYPGTHKEGLLPVRKLTHTRDEGQDPNANNEETIVPRQYKPLHVSVPRGAALYIHAHLVHGSNANRTQEWRYVLLNTYIRQGASFRPGYSAQRAAVAL